MLEYLIRLISLYTKQTAAITEYGETEWFRIRDFEMMYESASCSLVEISAPCFHLIKMSFRTEFVVFYVVVSCIGVAVVSRAILFMLICSLFFFHFIPFRIVQSLTRPILG